MIGDFHFIRPWWLLALIAAVAIALLVARAQRLQSRWETLIDPDLRDVLIERSVRRRGPWIPAVTGLALAIAALALAGPTWQRLPEPLAPIRAMNSPSWIVSVTFFRTSTGTSPEW